MVKKYKKLQVNNEGVTLVELVVTFALIGLFMVAATNVMMAAINMYHQVKGVSYGLQVSTLLQQKVVNELSYAQDSGIEVYGDDNEAVEASLVIYDSGSKVDFIDKYGSRIRVGLNDKGYLNIYHYPEFEEEDDDSGDVEEGIMSEGYNWEYDKKNYMGYTIKELKFSKVNNAEFSGNVILMEMTLYSSKYGEYKNKKYIECFNFDSTSANEQFVVK